MSWLTSTPPMGGLPPRDERIELDVHQYLDSKERVAVADIEPGPRTRVAQNVQDELTGLRLQQPLEEIGSERTIIFISIENGELDAGFAPPNDNPPIDQASNETCIFQRQYERAMVYLDGDAPEFDVLYDASGLLAFRGEETIAVAPHPYDNKRPREHLPLHRPP